MSDGRATVIGGGSWGTALAHLMAYNGNDVRLWMRNEERVAELNSAHTNTRYLKEREVHSGVVATSDLVEAAKHSRLIIVAIPSKHFREVVHTLGEHVTGEQILLSATKGFEAEHLKRMSEVLAEETCVKKVGAISGPNLADEVMDGHPTATVIASRFDEVVEQAESRLAGPTLRVYGNHDIVGVEIFGALKNVLAIASGIAAGVGTGMNSRAMLLTRGLAEITRFAAAAGGNDLTGLGLAGIGDIIATCMSPLSRNHTLGRKIAAGKSLEEARAEMHKVAEGVNTTRAICLHADRLGVDMPIARAVHRLLFEGHSASDVLSDLMARTSRFEHTERIIGSPMEQRGSVIESALAVIGRMGN